MNSQVIKDMWKEGGDGHFTLLDPLQFIRLFNDYQNFNGKRVLEFGPGNGQFAKWLLDTHKDITDYTIVDAPRSIEVPKKTLEDYKQVNFYEAQDFKEALKKDYDIFVSFNCLSETPPSYYTETFNTVKTKGIFIIDGDPHSSDFQKRLDTFSRKHRAKVVRNKILVNMSGTVSLHTRNM